MTNDMFNVIMGSIFHDIGKLTSRSEAIPRVHTEAGIDFSSSFIRNQDILDCIRFHHYQDIKGSGLRLDSPAFIVCAANNIASGTDYICRKKEGEQVSLEFFDTGAPLQSIFNLLNNNADNKIFKPFRLMTPKVHYPSSKKKISQNEYVGLLHVVKDNIIKTGLDPSHIDSILGIFEEYLSFIPASVLREQISDISFYDHAKMTAAIASNILLYFTKKNEKDYNRCLFEQSGFYDEKVFLMVSCDISGVQRFIYTIPGKGAMKSLRTRSFYLDILIEHAIDMLLSKIGVSRANIIFSGGGHAYLLLPNTEEIKSIIDSCFAGINKWLYKKVGTGLYIASAYQECSAHELMNIPLDQTPYQNIFRNLSYKLSFAKMNRYDGDAIRKMNFKDSNSTNGRECKVCGTVENLADEEDICAMCSSFITVSNDLIREDRLFIISDKRPQGKNYLPLPGQYGTDCYLYAESEADARAALIDSDDNILRIYGKNRMFTDLKRFIGIWMSDYYAESISTGPSKTNSIETLEELSVRSRGIQRIAVLRADVDNLGKSFVSGFVQEKESIAAAKYKYVTLARTASLSRFLSIFFKLGVNHIVKYGSGEHKERFKLYHQEEKGTRNLTIVYSGGDDLFLIGAWDDVIEAAIDIRRAFSEFTGGALHISAGIGIFDYSYPIALMADRTAELEEVAKSQNGKNSVALFGGVFNPKKGIMEYPHVYSWDEFENEVVSGKLELLRKYFSLYKKAGSALLYRLLQIAQGISEDRVNLARFAYQLGRLQPEANASQQKKELYREFCQSMYRWVTNEKERKQLITAIQITLYLERNQ